jgi:hypothetical protein
MLETVLKKLPYVMGLNRQISELEKTLDAAKAKIKSSETATNTSSIGT